MNKFTHVIATGVVLFNLGCQADNERWTNDGLEIKWPNETCQLRLSSTSIPNGSEEYDLLVQAMELWDNVGASDWHFTFSGGSADPNNHNDSVNYVTFLAEENFDPGVSVSQWIRASGTTMQEVDTWFNEEGPYGDGWTLVTNPSPEVLASPGVNGYSFYLAAVRATGISLALADYNNQLSAMNTKYPWGGTFADDYSVGLHVSERAGVRQMYPGSGSYTDLALANYYNVDDDYA